MTISNAIPIRDREKALLETGFFVSREYANKRELMPVTHMLLDYRHN